jgi:hypothetical protein
VRRTRVHLAGRLLDYPWGLLAFVAIAALYGLR